MFWPAANSRAGDFMCSPPALISSTSKKETSSLPVRRTRIPMGLTRTLALRFSEEYSSGRENDRSVLKSSSLILPSLDAQA